MSKRWIDWAHINWELSNTLLTKLLGTNYTTVSRQRKVHAPETVSDRKYHPPSDTDWEALDWSLQDTTLAKQTGVSRERVRQKRRALQKPDADKKKQHTARTGRKRVMEVYSPDKTVQQMAEEAKTTKATVSKVLGDNKLPFKRVSLVHPRWSTIDWSRSNKEISEEHGIVNPDVSRARKVYAPDEYKDGMKLYNERRRASRQEGEGGNAEVP